MYKYPGPKYSHHSVLPNKKLFSIDIMQELIRLIFKLVATYSNQEWENSLKLFAYKLC